MKRHKGRTITKAAVITIVMAIVAAFALNWFLTNRLENYLRKYLSDNVSDLTDGFYHFTFDSLSVGFFDGALSIRGIEMYPDSIAFARLKQQDSLPEVFFKVKIAAIDLKGINLTWRLNYRNLEFRSFEIQSPVVSISQKKNIAHTEDEFIPENPPKDLFDIISPYFDEISVRVMNMEKASISYAIEENQRTTAIYALHNADLHTYNFVLNKNSAADTRFMYCDNISFEATDPQTVLWNDHFKIETQHLGFNTRDSLIQVKGAKLIPHDGFWAQRTSTPGNYIDAKIELVEIKGMHFTQKNRKNEFVADSFKINNSQITCFSVNDPGTEKKEGTIKNSPDKETAAWTLYDVISPVLSKVAIKNLAFEQAILEYNAVKNGKTDNYKLQNYDFHANNFLLDSLVTERKQFWHCQDYIIEASGINGRVTSKNYNIALNKMLLNTHEGVFSLKDIRLSKLDSLHNENLNYITGTITSIDINGLELKEGVSATNLNIENPQVELFVVENDKDDNNNKEEQPSAVSKSKNENIWNLFIPYAEYLRIKNININNANVAYHNVRLNDNLALKKFYFYAKDFLVNEHTRRQPDIFFTCSDFGFQFSDFDNILPGKNYRLQIKEAELSHIKKYFVLRDIVLTPQKETWEKVPDIYFSLSTSLIEAQRSFFDNDWTRDSLNLMSLTINSPQLEIIKNRKEEKKEANNNDLVAGFLQQFGIGIININNANISYNDQPNNKQYDIKLAKSVFDSTKLSIKGDLTFNTLLLTDAEVKMKHNLQQSSINLPSAELQGFRYATDDNDRSFLSATSINIPHPLVNVDIMEKGRGDEHHHKENKKNDRPIYDLTSSIASDISIGSFKISDANLSFANNGTPSQNEIGNTNFSLEGLHIDSYNKTMDVTDIRFTSKNLRIPTANGYYTLIIGGVGADSKRQEIVFNDVHLLAKYPKDKFAYIHPKGKDWFDFKVDNITLSGIDIPSYFAKEELHATYLGIHNSALSNFKNQKIDIEHNKMPLIYEMLQHAPLKFTIDSLDVSNFSVKYDELARKGNYPGTILFSEMNGRMKNFTNIISKPNQLMDLHVDGKFMNSGKFNAVWRLPVSKDYDRFLLDVHLSDFPLTDLNQTFTPLASARVNSGYVKDVVIKMDATSEGASSSMLLRYNDLSVSLYKDPDMERPNKFANRLVALLLKKDNPDKGNKEPRQIESTIIRDKYHSTFNYLWQIIQPPLIESVGVSQQKQKMGKRLASFVSKIKSIFYPNRNKKKEEKKEENLPD